MDTINALGDAIDISNATSDGGADLFHAEFHTDFRSGLHFDLGGCISEHKANFQFEAPLRRFYLFGAFLIFYHILLLSVFFEMHFFCMILLTLHVRYLIFASKCRNFKVMPKMLQFFFRNLGSGCFPIHCRKTTNRRNGESIVTLSFNFGFWSDNI